MNNTFLQYYYIARFTLQTKTPMSVVTGVSDGTFDHVLLTDANGFPTIAGSSIAGVLRHLYTNHFSREEADYLFGKGKSKDEKTNEQSTSIESESNEAISSDKISKERASLIEVAWAVLQDEYGHAHLSLLPKTTEEGGNDNSLLSVARDFVDNPIVRDQTKLNSLGCVDNKFNRSILPKGFRFTCEITFWSNQKDDARWYNVLYLLKTPYFRLGGNTRTGLGAIEIEDLTSVCIDSRNKSEYGAIKKLAEGDFNIKTLTNLGLQTKTGPALDEILQYKSIKPACQIELKLKMEDFARIGQGDTSLSSNQDEHPVSLIPKFELAIHWDQQGKSEMKFQTLVFPASSIKGALSHRTGYHYIRLTQKGFIEDNHHEKTIENHDHTSKNEAVKVLFGHVANPEENDNKAILENKQKESAMAGRVVIDDYHIEMNTSELEKSLKNLTHNVIDRFTGGVRDRMLFTEQLLWQKEITLKLFFLPKLSGQKALTQSMKKAFRMAIEDLAYGRLALGSKSSCGHGYFTVDSDQACIWNEEHKAWFEQDEKETDA